MEKSRLELLETFLYKHDGQSKFENWNEKLCPHFLFEVSLPHHRILWFALLDQFSIQDIFSRASEGMLMLSNGQRSSVVQREKRREIPGFRSREIRRGCYFNSGLIRRDDGHCVRKGSQIRPPTLSPLLSRDWILLFNLVFSPVISDKLNNFMLFLVSRQRNLIFPTIHEKFIETRIEIKITKRIFQFKISDFSSYQIC